LSRPSGRDSARRSGGLSRVAGGIAMRTVLAARGESLAAFDGRCIPSPPQRGCRVGDPGAGCVAPPSNTPGILGRRALPAGRLTRLGATPDFHHGLLAVLLAVVFAVHSSAQL